MKLSDILSADSVLLAPKAKSKRQLLQDISEFAAQKAHIDSRTVFDTLLERENLGSTGFGNGVALPHGRLTELDKAYAFFVKLATPIDYDAIDNKPVDILFLLLSPESSGADHLTALAQISRLLKDKNLVTKLREAESQEEILALLHN
ncbi:MAG: PTS IIA-like nitrogen regulatory protein PtsN [Alphaproteobacteria bacterium]|nr:PTS IIA-like nitrogen regulatory protein PtsN [Alphaproteobacteria bacterium]